MRKLLCKLSPVTGGWLLLTLTSSISICDSGSQGPGRDFTGALSSLLCPPSLPSASNGQPNSKLPLLPHRTEPSHTVREVKSGCQIINRNRKRTARRLNPAGAHAG